MTSNDQRTISICANNIGGLSHIKATVLPGLNTIEEPNASGKTSFLRAVSLLLTPAGKYKDLLYMLKFDTDHGSVKLTDGTGNIYQKTISRKGESVIVEGDDIVPAKFSEMVKNFAIGGSDNEILTAIRNGQNLKTLLAEDFNTAEMNARIEERKAIFSNLTNKLSGLNEEITAIAGLEIKKEKTIERLEELKQRRDELDSEIQKISPLSQNEDDSSKEFRDLSVRIAQVDGDIKEALRLVNIDEKELQKLKIAHENALAKFSAKEEYPDISLGSMDAKVKNLSAALPTMRTRMTNLSLFVDATTKMMASNATVHDENLLSAISDSGNRVACPCCGNVTEHSLLKKSVDKYKAEAEQIKGEIDKITEQIKELETKKKSILQIQADIAEAKNRLRDSENKVIKIEEKLNSRRHELIELQETKNSLELKRNQLTTTIDNRQQKLNIEHQKVIVEIGKEELFFSNITSQLQDLHGKKSMISEIENNVRDAKKKYEKSLAEKTHREERIRNTFNETIAELYSALKFNTNITSITLDSDYNVVVNREGKKQPTQDTQSIKTLSKSELEVVGLVVMISGYIVNDLKTIFPYIVLDELTFLDSTRLQKLMKYMERFADYIILTKLPPEKEPINSTPVKMDGVSAQ